jgi:DNA-dependent protein kinase catalytic subunit
MFEKWVYTFGREMIVLSSLHPLVSGFHKLVSICFHICKDIKYFKVTLPGRKGVFDHLVLMSSKDVDIDGCFATRSGNAMETDSDAMEADAMETDTMETDAMETSAIEDTTRDRRNCFVLFRKFIKEVCML